MPEELNGQKPVEGQQPASMPNANQTPENNEGELPEDTSERTRQQFEKLKQSNQELLDKVRQLEEVNKRPQANSALDALKPTPPANPQVPGVSQDKVDDIIDKLTDENGYIDDEALKRALKEAKEEARKAREEAKQTQATIEQIQENEEVQKAHAKYPQLDPKSDKFDANFFELVKNELVGQMMRGEKNLLAAADKIALIVPPKKEETPAPNPEPPAPNKQEEQLRQISGTAPNRSAFNYEQADLATLRQKSIAGDNNAIIERLRRAGL